MAVTASASQDSLSIIGQGALAATTLTDVFVSTSRKTREVKAAIICNRGASTTFRVAFAPAGAADDTSQYLYYDTAIAANTSVSLDALKGVRVGRSDVIRVYAGAATLSASVFVGDM